MNVKIAQMVHNIGRVMRACTVFMTGVHLSLSAATVVSVGTETGGPGNGYIVENWSNAGVGKTYDVGGSEKYGTAGYYQIRPGDGSFFNEPAPDGNDMGISASSYPTLFFNPPIVDMVWGNSGSWVNYGAYYSQYRGPDGSSLYYQGGLSVFLTFAGTSPDGAGFYGNTMNFRLKTNAAFRVGFAVDSVGDGTYSANYVAIYNLSTGTVFSQPLTRDGVPDMAFFDISGEAGDTFHFIQWKNAPDDGAPSALALVTFDLLPATVLAAEISFVGTETGGAGDGYRVENWSNAGVGKTYDLARTEKYGTAGYYQLRPRPYPQSGEPPYIYEGSTYGHDLGVLATPFPTLSVTPAFVGTIKGGFGNWVNFNGYPVFTGADGTSLLQTGGLSLNITCADQTPVGPGTRGSALNFSLLSKAKFRMGIAVDTATSGTYAPNYVSVFNPSAGRVFSAAVTRDAIPDMVFFDISGNAGDTFSVSLWQTDNYSAYTPFSLVTFDLHPPAGTVLYFK